MKSDKSRLLRRRSGPNGRAGTNPSKEIELVKKLAENEVKGYEFEPALKNGKAVDSEVALTFWAELLKNFKRNVNLFRIREVEYRSR